MLKKILIIISALSICVCICLINARVINTKQIIAKEEIIITQKIEADNDLLVAYFSDLHYGNYINDEFLDNVINKINDFAPSIIIFGGDLIDHYATKGLSEMQKQHLIDSLKSLNSQYGKYACFGEDDLGNDGTFDGVRSILEAANFKIIDNKATCLNVDSNFINIIGINSLAYSNEATNNTFASINQNYFTFVVSHYPDIYDSIKGYGFDYMLAGHSHGGQIYFPIISLFNREEGCEQHYKGTISENNKILDISNGVGRTGVDARFNADAQINLYRFN